MKISLNWLKDYVDVSDIPVNDIIKKLTDSGLEVEDAEFQAAKFENMVVGFVKEKKKHPNADKLSLCVVTDETTDYNVVCGAPNVAQGQKIAFAKIGAVIPNGNFKIAKTKIRGEVSEGMICSGKELGINDDHSGIMVLDENAEIGKPLSSFLGLDDVILEIGITPNRPDALSHIGVARDVAAIFNSELKYPQIKIQEADDKAEDFASIEILNSDGCPRYSARVVKDVTIKESPEWLKKKLTSIGLRPINNIVDVTNFVLHEIGQPLHAFDLDELSGKKIVVKNAVEGEKFVTLDSKERKLKATDLMICDAEKPVAVAGVMGGENSEVSEKTKNILIESAYFNPSSVRKTSRSLQLSTDASYRFERGTDPGNTVWASSRAAQLMAELGGGSILKGVIDNYPSKIESKKVSVRFARIEKILGYIIPTGQVKEILLKLGLMLISEEETSLTFSVPTFRPDLEREIDLIEEVARIYGYDKIPVVERIPITLEEKFDHSEYKDLIRNSAIALGLNEIISISLISKEEAELFEIPVEVLNPQSNDMAMLRTSLLQGALQTVAKNLNAGEKNLKLFEVGDIFYKSHNGEIKSFNDFTEKEKISIILTGKDGEIAWQEKERLVDFYDLKALVNGLLSKIYLDYQLQDSYNHDGNLIFEYIYSKNYKNIIVGSGGLVRKDILKKFEINQDVYYFEFDINLLKDVPVVKKEFKELLKFPKVLRDCAFVVDKETTCDEIVESITKGSSKLLKKVLLFDVFENEMLGTGKKSTAFSLEYYDEKRTLNDDEVDKDFENMVNFVVKKLNAEFRGNN